MPALLTARNLPQTLLLTALFLMVAVATALLACGPVAQPTPGDDGALPAAQTSGGGEPTAELAEPTTPMDDGALPAAQTSGGDEPTAEPAAATTEPAEQTAEPEDSAATSTPEAEEAPDTPTPEAEQQTATPPPPPTHCVSFPPERQDTPLVGKMQIRVDGIKYQCFSPTATPTPTYPELPGMLDHTAVAGEAAKAKHDAGQTDVEIPTAHIALVFSSQANVDAAINWLQSEGIPLSQELDQPWTEAVNNRVVAIYGRGFIGRDSIDVIIPGHLLIPATRLDGFKRFGYTQIIPTLD